MLALDGLAANPIELSLADQGDYNEDHEFFGYRDSI